MARRNEEPFPQLLFAMFRNVPWWVGPPLIAVTFVVLQWVIPPLIGVPQPQFDSSTTEKAVGFSHEILRKSAADFSRLAAPWATLFVAAIWLFALFSKFVDAGRKAAAADRQQKR